MGDWADEKAEHALCKLCNLIAVSRDDIATIAQALRQARLDALEDAANPSFLRKLVEDQSKGEWDDKTIDEDVAMYSAAIRALKDKT